MIKLSSGLESALEAICETAALVCEASFGSVRLADGKQVFVAAVVSPLTIEEEPIAITPGGAAWRTILDGETFQHGDMLAEGSENGRRIAARDGWRTSLMTPIESGGKRVGYLTLRRSEVRLFTDEEIGLARGFAEDAGTALTEGGFVGPSLDVPR